MPRSRRRLLAAVLATLALAAPASGQVAGSSPDASAQQRSPQPMREGFWAEASVGGGRTWVGCTDCADVTARSSATAYVRAGGQINHKVLWGVEAMRSLEPTRLPAELDSAVAVANASLGPVVLWYPWSRRTFVKAGVGLALKRVYLDRAGQPRERLDRGVGAALSFGVGADVPVTRRTAVTLGLGAYYGAVGDVRTPSGTLDDVIATLYTATVGLTLR